MRSLASCVCQQDIACSSYPVRAKPSSVVKSEIVKLRVNNCMHLEMLAIDVLGALLQVSCAVGLACSLITAASRVAARHFVQR